MNKTEVLLILCVTAGAFIVPFLSRRLSIPSAVGEILYGLVMGLFLKEAAGHTHMIEFLGELGFILLMYLAGLEINFEKIKVTSRKNIMVFGMMFIFLVAASFLISILFSQPTVYGLIYSTTTVGLLFPVLKESGISGKELGQHLLTIGSVGEAISLIALTLFVLIFDFGISTNTLVHVLGIGVFFISITLFKRILYLLVWRFPNFIKFFLKTGDATETGVRANFVIIFIFVSFASIINLELIVGAFLGGMLFGLIFKEREKVQEKMSGFGYGFLIPIFFISVGLKFDLKDFLDPGVFLHAVFITLIIFLVRVVAALLLNFSNLKLSEIFFVPFAISFPLTLLVAIATFAYDSRIIGKFQASSILLAAILTAFIFPFLFKRLLLRYKRTHSMN